jgi:hypothetical protein
MNSFRNKLMRHSEYGKMFTPVNICVFGEGPHEASFLHTCNELPFRCTPLKDQVLMM